MCGIIAYIGKQPAYPILVRGLKKLEYRGYDSAGIGLIQKDRIAIYKKQGRVFNLEEYVQNKNTAGSVGIGHTRWATHGVPNDINSHPHLSQNGTITLVHNGIIENYATLKKALLEKGYTFQSDTDTEVLCYLIDDIKQHECVTIDVAVQLALQNVVGAYAIVVMCSDEPDRLVAAKKSSPLVIGIGNDGDYYLASDASPIIEYTNRVVYLNDNELAITIFEQPLKLYTNYIEKVHPTLGVGPSGWGTSLTVPYIQELELKLDSLEKGGYDHFMLKEIYEQPRTIKDCCRGRLQSTTGTISLGGIKDYEQQIINADRIIMVGCGTSWHACMVGEYLIEGLARINVEVEYASEFRYRNPIITKRDIVIAVSQSGETADTIAALELAKNKGALVLGICNVVGSTISRMTNAGIYTHAGPEIGVASTKAFTAQVTILTLLALLLAKRKGTVTAEKYEQLLVQLEQIPEQIGDILKVDIQNMFPRPPEYSIIKELVANYQNIDNALYLGRGILFPVALEGALKLKEISYIHAEGYPAAEMKHGPIALIDHSMPVIVLATKGLCYEKMVSNIQEVKARNGKVLAIVTEGDQQVQEYADTVIVIPETDEYLTPLLATIPLQLLAYYFAIQRGCDVDRPRNLAKSVTVE